MNSMSTDDPETLTSVQAEKYLQDALGEPDGYWRVFLQNNRRPDRAPRLYVIPFLVSRGRPVYRASELDIFITRHQAETGLRGKTPSRIAKTHPGKATPEHSFAGRITRQVDESTGIAVICLHLQDTDFVYTLEPEQARQVGTQLIQAADGGSDAGGHES
jgi:hypothetical protein